MKKQSKIFITIIVLIALTFGIFGFKYTYSLRPQYSATFHQAWGQDGDPNHESANLPKTCNTKYGEDYFNECINSIGTCARWSTQKNGGSYGTAQDSYYLGDITYNFMINTLKKSQDFYCIAGTSLQPEYPMPTPPELISINGEKIWQDNNNQDGLRPEEVIIDLFDGVNAEPYDSVKVTAENNWKYQFDDLLKSDNGVTYNYYVKERPVSGYTSKVDGYNIINTHNPKALELKITKTWNDANDKDGIRPKEVTVELYNGIDSSAYKIITLSKDNNWEYSFTDLPEKINGKQATYTIKELPIDGYETNINGYSITNTHTPIENPKTGNILIFVTWIISLTSLTYSFIYFRKIMKANKE